MTNQSDYVKFNNYRKADYRLRTEIKRSEDKEYVYKIAETKEAEEFIDKIFKTYERLSQLNLPFKINKTSKVDNRTLQFEYIKGTSLLAEFDNRKGISDTNKLIDTLKDFNNNVLNKIPSERTTLKREFSNIFGSTPRNKQYEVISPGILDLNLDNIIKDKDGGLHLIDYEWTFDFPIPKKYIFFRTVFNCFVSKKFLLSKKLTFEDVLSKFEITESEISQFFEWERIFQEHVFDRKLETTDLVKHKDTNLVELQKEQTIVTSKSEVNENMNSLKRKMETIEEEKALLFQKKLELEAQHNQLSPDAEEFRTFKQTKIWKALTIYRKLKKYSKNFFINIYRDGPTTTFRRIFERIDRIIKYRKQRRVDQNRYKYWLKNNRITKKRKKEIKEELNELSYLPLISIIMPVYNVDVKWIKKAIKSIKDQIYTNWELCIADDASTDSKLIKYLKSLEKKPKIKITYRKKNGHISEASNSALELADGEFVALMDNDDIIHPHALAEVVKVLNEKKDTDFIYSDEDKLEMNGQRVEPFFKPDWSPDFFMSTNYLSHLSVIRKKLVDNVGGFRKGFEGSQDYDLFLRITEKTDNIEHIPDIFYSWRRIPGSTASTYDQKGYANKTSIRALEETIERRRLDAKVEQGAIPGFFRVKYNIKGNPLVSILIPTKDKYKYIERCISSLFEKTTYENFELIIIDTGSTQQRVLDYYETIKTNPKISFLHWNKEFNYSAVNNFGVKNAKGEYILLLNNDTEIITPDWIEGMLEHAQRESIGAVGVKLFYPNDTIQHAGVVLGTHGGDNIGAAGHAFVGFSKEIHGPSLGQKDIIRNYSAVTAACLMTKKSKYESVGGLDEKYKIAFNDVDFCLKLRDAGYYNIYTPHVELYHHESVSVGTIVSGERDIEGFKKEIELLNERWKEWIWDDPFYNINLSLVVADYSIKISKE